MEGHGFPGQRAPNLQVFALMISAPIREQEETGEAQGKLHRRGLSSVLYSLSAKLLVVGLNAATGILTARALHPQGRGELAALLLWPQVLSGALTFGLPSALTFQIRRQRERTPQFLLASLAMGLLIGSVASAGAILLAPVLLHQYRPEVARIGQWLMPNLIIGIYLLLGRAALEADRDFAQSGIVLIGPPLLTLAGLIGLLSFHALTPLSAGIAYTLSGIPPFLYLWSRLPLDVHQQAREIVSAGKALLSYGIRSYGIDLCGTLGFYVDQALVVSMLSPESMGTYVVALSASRVLNVPMAAMAAVLFPSMVGLERPAITALVQRALRIGSTLALVSAVITALCGHLLLLVIYGPAFAAVGLTLVLLTVEAALSGCVSILAQSFMAIGRPGIITVQQVIGLACCVPCLLVLIPRWGVTGAAASILFSTLIRFWFAMHSFRRSFSGRVPRLLLDRESFGWLCGHFYANFPALRKLHPAFTGELPGGGK